MNTYYRQTLEKVEEILDRVIPPGADRTWGNRISGSADALVPDEAYGLINAPARDLLGRGGKRWRPVLMSFCCELCGGGDAALPFTPLVELPHNGSLIIDDIEDSSDTRRGSPAVHLVHGMDMAINTGNFLYFLPQVLIDESALPVERKYQLYSLHAEALRRLHLGQGLDIQWHRDPGAYPSRGAYLRMCRFKTGSLAALAGQAGALLAGASAEIRLLLGNLMEDLGVAFQIIDDVTNLTTGNPGKDRGDDIVEGKKSLPVILLAEKNPASRDVLSDLFLRARSLGIRDGREVVEEAIGLMDRGGAIDEARKEAEEMLLRVRETLTERFQPSPAREAVEELVASFL
jgi:octaprenyl-diphosphate synthase